MFTTNSIIQEIDKISRLVEESKIAEKSKVQGYLRDAALLFKVIGKS